MSVSLQNRIKKRSLVLLVLIFFFVSAPFSLLAESNPQINYQGKLTDSSGVAVTDGTYNMNFWLVPTSGGATSTAIWSETLTGANKVQVTNGLFSVMLGDVSSLASVDFNQVLYLGVEIGGTASTPAWDGEMSPRKIIGTVPAAFTAREFDGLATTSFIRSDEADIMEASSTSALLTLIQNGSGNVFDLFSGGTSLFTVLNGGNVGIGTTTPAAKLSVAGTDVEINIGGFFGAGYGAISLNGTANANTYNFVSGNSATDNSLYINRPTGGDINFRENNGMSQMVISAGGNVGIGSTTPAYKLSVDGTSRTTGAALFDSTLGVTGQTTLTNASSTNLTVSTDSYLGTVKSGTWNGTAIGALYGGTGLSSYSTGDLIYASGANTLSNRAIGTTGDVLSVVGGVPSWVATSTLGLGGGGSSTFLGLSDTQSSFTANRVLFTNSDGDALTDSAKLTFDDSTLSIDGDIDMTAGNSYNYNGLSMLRASTTLFSYYVGNSGNLTSTGESNTSVGYQALFGNTTGAWNTGVGAYTLLNNTTGGSNTAIGRVAMNSNITGDSNTAIGNAALYDNVTGDENTAIGSYAGFDINTATSTGANTLIGFNSGRGIITGINNTVIGANVTGLSSTLSNNIIIADGAGNRRINVDSTGNVGFGTTTPSSKLTIDDTRSISANYDALDVNLVATHNSNGLTSTAGNFQSYSDTAANSILYGVYGEAYKTGSNGTSVTGVYGKGLYNNDSTGTSLSALSLTGTRGDVAVTGTGNNTISVAYSLYGDAVVDAGSTLTDYVGLFLDTPGGAGTYTNKWGVYQEDAGSDNYFAGSVGIGNDTPANLLDVVGSAAALSIYDNRSPQFNGGGELLLQHTNNSSIRTTYASIKSDARDGSVGAEDAKMHLKVIGAGTLSEVMTLVGDTGNVGVGTTSPLQKLTVAGDGLFTGSLSVLGAFKDSNNATGTNGMVLQTTGSGTQWVATSTLGLGSGGGSSTFLGLTDTISSFTANRLMFTNSGATALTDSADLTFDGTNFGLGSTTGIAFGGVRFLNASTTNDSIIFGRNAGETFTSANTYNVAIGYQAGRYASTSNSINNNFIGYEAGYNNSGAEGNNSIGWQAGYNNTGNDNNLIGALAGRNNTGINSNILGLSAGFSNTGSENVLIGSSAGYSNTGSNNNIFGEDAGNSNTGDHNTIFGQFAGYFNTGNENNILGNSAGGDNIGSYNNLLGSFAGQNNTGSYNEMIGYKAGNYLQSTSSVIVGAEAYYGAAESNFQAVNNTALGFRAGYNASTGADNNILVGYQAGDNLTTGSNNIVLGYDVDLVSATGDNQLNIGNLIFGTSIDGTGSTISSGNIGIGTTTPGYKLTVAGDGLFTGSLSVLGAFKDSNNASGTNGMILQTTGSGTQWVATSTLGLGSGGGSSTFLGLTDTQSSFTSNRVLFTNSGGTAVTDSPSLVFNGTNLGVGTTTPSKLLHLYSAGTPSNQILIEGSASTTGYTSASVILSSNRDTNFRGLGTFYHDVIAQNEWFSGRPYSSSDAFMISRKASVTTANSGAATSDPSDASPLFYINNSGNVGIGTTTYSQKLTVAGDGLFTGSLSVLGAFKDSNNASGTNGMILQTTGSGTQWVATSTLGITSGQWTTSGSNIYYNGGSVGIGTSTPSTKFHVSGGDILVDAGYKLSALNSVGNIAHLLYLDGSNDLVFGATSNFNRFKIGLETNAEIQSINGFLDRAITFSTGGSERVRLNTDGNLGIGTTTPESRLAIEKLNYATAGAAGIDQYFSFTNSTASAIQYGNRSYLNVAPTATTTLVGNMLRLNDSTSYGNVIRGLEVQADRGSNTQGENTALSGFARTFGVRGTTQGDAGGLYEPAGVFAETEGTTQGNAIRGYSSSITTATLLSLFQDTSTFTGTGLSMNFGNSGGSFSSTTASKFVDLQNAGSSMFTIGSYGMATIGNGTTNNNAGLQIGYGGICVDNDGSCTASTTGRVSAVSYHTGNSDLAEMYFSNEDLKAGEIVYIKNGLSVGRADTENKNKVIGVVSTKPGQLLGFDDTSLNPGEESYPIALKGRVPIRLSNENGPIKAGDELMLSSIDGVATKATSTGKVIGVALEDFDDSRAYSDTYINQFGDDLVDPVITPIDINNDPRIHDGCYYGGGNASGDTGCTPLISTSTDGQRKEAEALARAEAEKVALAQLNYVPSESLVLEDGQEVKVGQIVMFVNLSHRYLDDEGIEMIDSLLAKVGTSTAESEGGTEQEGDTIWQRLVKLATNFVDGVLSIFTLKADRVEVKEEFCIDGVCLNADDLRELLKERSTTGSSSSSSKSPATENNNNSNNDNNVQNEDPPSTPTTTEEESVTEPEVIDETSNMIEVEEGVEQGGDTYQDVTDTEDTVEVEEEIVQKEVVPITPEDTTEEESETEPEVIEENKNEAQVAPEVKEEKPKEEPTKPVEVKEESAPEVKAEEKPQEEPQQATEESSSNDN